MSEQTARGEEFTVLDVAILVLEAVGVLHSRGHQRLRIFPGMSGSGMYWRTAITHAENVVDEGDYTVVRDFDAAFHYTTGSEFEVAGERVDATTTAADLADRILRTLPEAGLGRDWEYAGWYAELLGLVREQRTVPIAYADFFDDARGWEIGWGSGRYIPKPPTASATTSATSPLSSAGATFTGTLAQFNRYLGPHWRVRVQQWSKKHKGTVGACQFDPAHDGPFDAAHIHGRERPTLLHQLLGSPGEDDAFTVDLADLDLKFKEEHTPIEKSILVLCQPCHKKYDTPASATTPTSVATGSPSSADQPVAEEAQPGALVLPITLEPRDAANFKAELLASRAAWIDVHFRDGHVERQPWFADKLKETSSIAANLRSRPSFRQGKWQELGIVAVHVSVATAVDIAQVPTGPGAAN